MYVLAGGGGGLVTFSKLYFCMKVLVLAVAIHFPCPSSSRTSINQVADDTLGSAEKIDRMGPGCCHNLPLRASLSLYRSTLECLLGKTWIIIFIL